MGETQNTGAAQADGLSQAEPVTRLGPSGFDPSRGAGLRWLIQNMAEDLAVERRNFANAGAQEKGRKRDDLLLAIAYGVQNCLRALSMQHPAIAMEARQGGDGETRLHPKDDSAGPQDIAQDQSND